MDYQSYMSRRAKDVPRVGSRESGDWADAARKEGVDVVSLSGAPLTLPGPNVIEAAARAAREFAKAPSRGLPELREAISHKVQREQGFTADPGTEILITNGAMQALYVIMTALLDPGDEILVTRPGFFYHGIAELVGARCVYLPTDESQQYRYDIDGFERVITNRTKLFMLTSPNNPTGHVATRKELEGIARLADKHDLLVVSDDSYEKMVYDGRQHISFASLDGVKERAITVQSFTKSYAMSGWRVGYIIAKQPLIETFLKVLEWMVLACGYVQQKAAAAAMTGPQDWVDAIGHDFQQYRDAMCGGLDEIDGLTYVRPEGGPFVFPNVSRFGMSASDFARYILDEFGVRSEPGEVFQEPGHIRLAFGARSVKDVETATERLRAAADKLRT